MIEEQEAASGSPIAELVRAAEVEAQQEKEAAAAGRAESRTKVVGALVKPAEEGEIVMSFLASGFRRNPDGSPAKASAARLILVAFARSLKVRDAVAVFLSENPDLLKD